MRNEPTGKVERILVVKLSSIGDLFHALPTVNELKSHWQAVVDWVVHEQYVDLVGHFTDVDRVIGFPRRRFAGEVGRFSRELRSQEYDLVVDLQGLLKSALVCRLARGKRRLGPSFHREGSRLLYSAVAGECDRERHAVDQCLDAVRYFGIRPSPVVFPLDVPDVPVGEGRPRVAIHPVSRWPSKNWPEESFIELARRLQAEAGAALYLLGCKDDEDVCARIASAVGKDTVVNTAGRRSLAETVGLLQEMDLLISNDSGPVHMAVAVGTRVLALFGPTDPVRTGPYGEAHKVVVAPLPCRPCFSRVCEKHGSACMLEIAPETVFRGAMEVLAAARSTAKSHV